MFRTVRKHIVGGETIFVSPTNFFCARVCTITMITIRCAAGAKELERVTVFADLITIKTRRDRPPAISRSNPCRSRRNNNNAVVGVAALFFFFYAYGRPERPRSMTSVSLAARLDERFDVFRVSCAIRTGKQTMFNARCVTTVVSFPTHK